ncbi:MAG TPA: hypothetical protein VGB63_09665 [Pedobacter sp.]
MAKLGMQQQATFYSASISKSICRFRTKYGMLERRAYQIHIQGSYYISHLDTPAG